jgi:hypothetical protein
MNNIRKAFKVYIYDKLYWVWNIDEGLKPPHRGENDTIPTWWLYYSDRIPEGAVPPIDSESWVPYNKGISRVVWNISIKQKNTTKEKWGETRFHNHTWVEMRANGRLVYEFSTMGGISGLSYAMAKVGYMQVALLEHAFNFLEPEEEDGRKIWWKGLPAFVKIATGENKWEISIVPDYSNLSRDQWWSLLAEKEKKIGPVNKEEMESDQEFADIDDEEDDKKNDLIRWGDAYSDQHINWFRK